MAKKTTHYGVFDTWYPGYEEYGCHTNGENYSSKWKKVTCKFCLKNKDNQEWQDKSADNFAYSMEMMDCMDD